VVDEGRVARLLRGVTERTGRLRAAFAVSDRGDLWLDGVKYLFVTSIEGCVDVAQHIASSEGLGAPDSNADALRLLGRDSKIVSSELADRMALAVGFRNVLVHQYAVVDDRIVLAAVERLGDFDDFVAQVSVWMTTPES
jgi:uncharacterized protein YutE (UPF0331/DUF86 family)